MAEWSVPWRAIKCEADLPNVRETVLVTTQFGSVIKDWVSSCGWWHFLHRAWNDPIAPTAWAPMPAPYVPEEGKTESLLGADS